MVRRVIAGQSVKAVAAAFGVCGKTVNTWLARFRTEGVEGLRDRSSRPHRLRPPTAASLMTPRASLLADYARREETERHRLPESRPRLL
jgi:transposase